MDSRSLAAAYNAFYYAHNCGEPYGRSEAWLKHFTTMADSIISDIAPRTVLDAGCAMGFLVEALRDRGVAAWGIDISDYAIAQVRPDIKSFCRVGSITDPLPQDYDLVVCIEVLEHLAPLEGERALANLCRHTDDILFSSTPFDFKEVTHVNVRPPEYWAAAFAQHGFFRDVGYEAGYLPLWAMRFRRQASAGRVVAAYERRLWQLRQENQGRLELSLQQHEQLAQREVAQQTLTEQLTARELSAQKTQEAQARIEQQAVQLAKSLKEQQQQLTERERLIQTLEAQALSRERALQWLSAEMILVTGSKGWQLLQRLWRLRRWLAPRGSQRAQALRLALLTLRVWRKEGPVAVARKTVRKLHLPFTTPATLHAAPNSAPPVDGDPYQTWLAENEPNAQELAAQPGQAARFAQQPLISIITPTYNTPPALLQATIESLIAQTYPHWELCVADGNSTSAETKELLQAWAERERRVRVKFLERNLGISGNSNEALGLARGEFIALLDHDDLLPAHALFAVVKLLNERPATDFIYTDKDLINEAGTERFNPLFKPAWSPEMMLSANYLTHLCVIRKRLADQIGGFNPEVDGAQDWDFFLRLCAATDKIAHLPQVLYHWRVWGNSVASGIAAKPYALQAQQHAIEAHLQRQGLTAHTSFDERGWLRVTWPVTQQTKVSIIIASSGQRARLQSCLTALLERTAYRNFEVLLVHHGARNRATTGFYRQLANDERVRVLDYEGPFNWAAVNNFGARHSRGQALLFLDENTEALEQDWLEELVRWTERPEIGAVGGRLLRPDGTIQHAGVIIGLNGLAGHLFAGEPAQYYGINGSVGWYRNYLALSGDCLMMQRQLFEELGGFDEEFISGGSDLELCLRVAERGRRIVYTPFATLRQQMQSPNRAEEISRAELAKFRQRYSALLQNGDPYFNPNLSTWSLTPAFKQPGEDTPLEFVERGLREEIKLRWQQPSLPRPATPPLSRGPRFNNEAGYLVSRWDFTRAELEASRQLQAATPGRLEIRTLNWFIPSFTHAYYGGIYTILRCADYLHTVKGVESRFIVVDEVPPEQIKTAIATAFPNLARAEVHVVTNEDQLAKLEPADAAIATLWTTAYYVLKFNRTRRKFYFMQDCEPLFYPAGSTSAQVEATYRFGFYALANTQSLKAIYEQEYGGTARHFTPCVDTHVFYPATRPSPGPLKVFFYGRPGHPRNGFELGAAALHQLKRRLGGRVAIYSAGAVWHPAEYGLEGVVDNLGLLSYEQTAALYRTCAAGLVMMFTKHPSYLPFELMASGALVISNYNPATTWFLKDKENCLLSEPSVSCLADTVAMGLLEPELRRRLIEAALQNIRAHHARWEEQLAGIYDFMCAPTVPVH